MAILSSTPKKDGFYMPAEYAPQSMVWMIWPQRPDNWREQARPAQRAFAQVAEAISAFTPVTMLSSREQLHACRAALPPAVRVLEMESDDAWCRDVGPTFLLRKHEHNTGSQNTCPQDMIRAVDWTFNAWGGHVDGLYDTWERDDAIAGAICDLEGIDRYRTDGFVMEGGAFHVDGEGTVMTTQMCLLSAGRNPSLSEDEIGQTLMEYLGCDKVLWLKDGIDPDETNGHVDDIACFIRPGEAACIWTEDCSHPFYEVARRTYEALCCMTDAKGRFLKVHRITLTSDPVYAAGTESILSAAGTKHRSDTDLCAASYLNFLITNGGVIVPQFDDPNDRLALRQLQELFPDKKVVGVPTREIVYGGGNIHCITQQQPVFLR